MGRILSLVVACAIPAVPPYVAGASPAAPALASTANPGPTSAGTAKTTTNAAPTTTAPTTTRAPTLPGSGGSFQVLDANATDTNGAIFQLPFDVSTSWTVWARALGKPGGTADMTTCATVTVVDPLNPLQTIQEVVCSTTLTLTRSKNAKFQDVTKELLTINTGTALVGACTSTTVTLFDQCLQNYFWNYDNHGLKLLQLRFYPVSGGGG